jgi:hypothetical protein
MTEMLPPAYWADIHRYLGELLVSTPLNRTRFLAFVSESQEATWTARHPDYNKAQFKTGRVTLLGMSRSPWHVVRLSNPTERRDYTEEYSIHFDPKTEVITSATHQTTYDLPGPEAGAVYSPQEVLGSMAAVVRGAFSNAAQSKQLKEMGLTAPSPVDYDVLHNELRYAAGQQLR